MHELSVADALVELVRRRLPAGALLRRITVRIGPLHAIAPEAMQWAWKSAAEKAGWSGAQLELDLPPWRLRCLSCGRRWQSALVDELCVCGAIGAVLEDGAEMLLLSFEYDAAEMASASAPSAPAPADSQGPV